MSDDGPIIWGRGIYAVNGSATHRAQVMHVQNNIAFGFLDGIAMFWDATRGDELSTGDGRYDINRRVGAVDTKRDRVITIRMGDGSIAMDMDDPVRGGFGQRRPCTHLPRARVLIAEWLDMALGTLSDNPFEATP